MGGKWRHPVAGGHEKSWLIMKGYSLEFTTRSEREFFALPKLVQERIKKKMEFFISSEDPLRFSKKLHGLENQFRFRIGDYRVIVTPRENKTLVILVILKIGHRSDVYED